MPASQSMTEALAYTWDQSAVPRDVPRFSVERAVWRFRRSLPEYVWDAAVLEGNPFTYPEVHGATGWTYDEVRPYDQARGGLRGRRVAVPWRRWPAAGDS